MSALDELSKLLDKEIGENDENQEVTEWLDSGYPGLNKALSGRYDGGFGYGRMYEIYGPPSAGKTALAVGLMIAAQKKGGAGVFIDYERTLDVGMAKRNGLKTDSPLWVYKRPKTWEEGNTIAMRVAELIRQSKALDPSAPIVVVQDSIAAAIPKSMIEKGIDELSMNDTTALSRVTSTTLKVIASWVAEYNVIMVYLNQIRTKPGVLHGDPTTTPGGGAMEFYASGRISLGKSRIVAEVEKGKGKELIGQKVICKITKSKHTKPFQQTDLFLDFEDDGCAVFDPYESLFEHLKTVGAIEMAGSRVKWEGGTPYASQLLKKLREEDAYDKLLALVPRGEK